PGGQGLLRRGGCATPMTVRFPWERRLVAWAIVFALAPAAFAATADHDASVPTLARERAIRSAGTATPDRLTYLRHLRASVPRYKANGRRYPATAYGDQVLWHAGRLALDAYGRFGEARDRDIGVQLLQRLTAEHPRSTLTKLVPAALPA